jgi:hypothetical protein
MLASAGLAFVVVLLVSYLSLEVSPIFSIFVFAMPTTLLSIAIGITSSRSVDTSFDTFRSTALVAASFYFLLVLEVVVWVGAMHFLKYPSKTKRLWVGFVVGFSLYIIGVITALILYYRSPTFRNTINGTSISEEGQPA